MPKVPNSVYSHLNKNREMADDPKKNSTHNPEADPTPNPLAPNPSHNDNPNSE